MLKMQHPTSFLHSYGITLHPFLAGKYVAAHNAEYLGAKLEFPLVMFSKNNTFQSKSLNLNQLCS